MAAYSSKSLTYLYLPTLLFTYLLGFTYYLYFCMQLSKNSANLAVNREIFGLAPFFMCEGTAEDVVM